MGAAGTSCQRIKYKATRSETLALNLQTEVGGDEPFVSTFQVADMCRPLMSVSQICENGHKCIFEKGGAMIVSSTGEELCYFASENGLYVAKMKLKPPSPFHRQER